MKTVWGIASVSEQRTKHPSGLLIRDEMKIKAFSCIDALHIAVPLLMTIHREYGANVQLDSNMGAKPVFGENKKLCIILIVYSFNPLGIF